MINLNKQGRKQAVFLLLIVGLLSFVFVSVAWAFTSEQYRVASLKPGATIMLDVPPLVQLQGTSCGETVIVMAHNYAHPQTPLIEQDVIAYAAENRYFTEEIEPFTSPAHMIKIARHYTSNYSNGVVFTDAQGLALLIGKLQNGEPIIIDVLTRLDDPTSGAHFVLVTGIARDSQDPTLISVFYNNPQTGLNESALWGGKTGIWHAWSTNPDPGGHGWWLVFSLK